jgi:hypothetical protein
VSERASWRWARVSGRNARGICCELCSIPLQSLKRRVVSENASFGDQIGCPVLGVRRELNSAILQPPELNKLPRSLLVPWRREVRHSELGVGPVDFPKQSQATATWICCRPRYGIPGSASGVHAAVVSGCGAACVAADAVVLDGRQGFALVITAKATRRPRRSTDPLLVPEYWCQLTGFGSIRSSAMRRLRSEWRCCSRDVQFQAAMRL